MKFEISKIREANRVMFDLKGLDDELRFFYDETNNIRKYYLKENKFNESIKTNFVLGGVVLEEGQEVELQPLFDSFGLQKNVVEVKLMNLVKGNFIDCLKSIHLQTIFKYLINNKLFIHYSSLNFLYYAVVDIIDSLCAATDIRYDPFYNRALKNDFYLCVKNNIEKFIQIFYKYEYPNIKKENASEFIDLLINIFNNEPKSIGQRTILMLLNGSKKTENLFFIMDEKSHQLIEKFTHFYSRPIYLFLNAKHFFDKEDSIEPLINELEMTHKENRVENFSFIDSKDNLFIQLSDIIIGLIGKFYNFINENSIYDIEEQLNNIGDEQQRTLSLFYNILEESEKRNKAYIFLSISNDELNKISFIKKLYLEQ